MPEDNDTVFVPISTTGDGPIVYLWDYAGITRSTCRSNIYFDTLRRGESKETVDDTLDRLGWEIVKIEVPDASKFA